jgi:hypothetical protein
MLMGIIEELSQQLAESTLDGRKGKAMLLSSMIKIILQQSKKLSSTTPDAGLLSFFFC